MKTGGNTRGRKGVSTIIAAIFILATLLAFLLTFTFILQRMATTTSNVIRANQLLLQKQQERLTINSITITGTSVTITVTNDGTQPIILVNYIIRNNTVKIVGKISPEKYIAPQTRTTLTITTPYTLSPASTYEITLISKLGNAFKATYPIPTTNATTLPGIQASLANTYLPRIAGEGTVTWAGTATIPTPQTRAGNVISYTALTGTATGIATNLNYADNQNITATPTPSYVIIRERRTAIFYDDFLNDPFSDGNLTAINGFWYWDSVGHYVEQVYPLYGEYIAVINTNLSSVNPFASDLYTLIKLNIYYVPSSFLLVRGASGVLQLNSSTWFYELGARTNLFSEVYQASIRNPISLVAWDTIPASNRPQLGEWFYVLALRTSQGVLNSTLLDINGNYLASTSYTDTYFSPVELSLGTWYAATAFDDVVVTVNASPLWVNITAPGSFVDYNVSIYNASGYLVGSAIFDASGHASVNIIKQPIIRNGEIVIYDKGGNEVVSSNFAIIVGGDVYNVKKYVSSLEVRTSVNLSGTIIVSGSKVSSTSVGIALQSSLDTTVFYVYAYSWSSGTFVKVYNATGGVKLNVTGLPASLVNPTNGTVVLKLLACDDSPFTLQVDCLNAFPDVWVPVSQDVLLVGEGGTSYIDVFKLSGVVPGSVTLSYWETIDVPGMVFNGSADITYDDYVSYSLLLVNGSGVYRLDLLNPSASPVFVTDACRASLGGGVRAEVVHDSVSGRTYLVVLPGVGNQSFCVYNLTAYPSGGAWLINFASRGLNVSSPYTVSAVAVNGTRVYTILQNTTSKAAVLAAVDPFTNSTFIPPSNTANLMPGLSNVGLAYDGKYLWLMLEGGSLYKVNPTYANFTNVPVLFLPAPIGYGDRMEYYNGALILVRDSGSSEVWVIPTS